METGVKITTPEIHKRFPRRHLATERKPWTIVGSQTSQEYAYIGTKLQCSDVATEVLTLSSQSFELAL